MTETPDFTWLFIKMMAGLVICLGLAVVFIRVVLPRTRMGRGARGGWASILDTVRVDQRKSLHMVKIAERYFVLGSGEESLSLITELSPAEWEKAVAADSPRTGKAGCFGSKSGENPDSPPNPHRGNFSSKENK